MGDEKSLSVRNNLVNKEGGTKSVLHFLLFRFADVTPTKLLLTTLLFIYDVLTPLHTYDNTRYIIVTTMKSTRSRKCHCGGYNY